MQVDIDCLLSENRFLRESLDETRDEKNLSNEMGKRYKNALEQSKPIYKDSMTVNTNQVNKQDMSKTCFKTAGKNWLLDYKVRLCG